MDVTMNEASFSLAEQNKFRKKALELGGKRNHQHGYSWQITYTFEDEGKGKECYEYLLKLPTKSEYQNS